MPSQKVYGTHLLHHSPACSRRFSHSLHSARGSLHRCAVQPPLAVARFASLVAVALVVARIVRARHPARAHLHLPALFHQPAPPGAQINLYATRNSTRLHRADTCAACLTLTRPWLPTGSLSRQMSARFRPRTMTDSPALHPLHSISLQFHRLHFRSIAFRRPQTVETVRDKSCAPEDSGFQRPRCSAYRPRPAIGREASPGQAKQ